MIKVAERCTQRSPKQHIFRLILFTFFAVCLSLSFYLAYRIYQFNKDRIIITGEQIPANETVYSTKRRTYRTHCVDNIVGFRPGSNLTVEGRKYDINEEISRKYKRHQNNLGFTRQEDTIGEIRPPRVLLVGDSHMHGIVSTHENASTLLEDSLRNSTEYSEATVLNASCGRYSLYQYVLRVKSLISLLRPNLIVIVIFMGNDFSELEYESRPHLNDDFMESGPATNPRPHGASKRFKKLALPKKFQRLFNQGLNQAAYLLEHPERKGIIIRKAHKCIILLKSMARQYKSKLLFVLLPSYDMVFPEEVEKMSNYASEAVNGLGNMDLLEHIENILDEEGCQWINLLPFFSNDTRPYLYANDFHIWVAGHQLLAESIYEKTCEMLQ